MNLTERFFAVFQNKPSHVIPWFADLTYWISSQEQKGILPERYKNKEGMCRLHQELGCGVYGGIYTHPYKVEYENIEVVTTKKDKKTRTEWRTPIGIIWDEWIYLPESYCNARTEYFIKSIKDFEVLKYIYEHQVVKPDQAACEEQNRFIEKYQNTGIGVVHSGVPRTPFARLLVEWAGVANTFYALNDEPAMVERIIELMSKTDDPIYDLVSEAPAPFVGFGENITGEVVSPRIFQKYYGSYYKKRTEQLHKKNKFLWVHIDGTLKTVLPLVQETGMDCVEGITPAPVGDVEVEDLRRYAGSEIIIFGGMPGPFFTAQYSIDEFKSFVLKIIKIYKKGGKFILGTGDQVPPDGDIGRVKLVSELIEKYGQY